MTQSEEISRKDEIRAILVLGLLAVLASIRVQFYSTNTQMMIKYPYGSFDLLPILDNILLLWSLYALFMIIGLSGDVIGNKLANSLRGVANIFLQWTFIIMGAFSIPLGFIVYGERFLSVLLIMGYTVIVGLLLIVIFKK